MAAAEAFDRYIQSSASPPQVLSQPEALKASLHRYAWLPARLFKALRLDDGYTLASRPNFAVESDLRRVASCKGPKLKKEDLARETLNGLPNEEDACVEGHGLGRKKYLAYGRSLTCSASTSC